MAENGFFAVVVFAGMEFDFRLHQLVFAAAGPAGEAPRDFHDVLLRVAAVDAERVQLEQLTAVVFIRLVGRARFAVLAAVEIDEHRGGSRRRLHHVAEFSQRVPADGVAIVGGLEPRAVGLADVDVEVIRPELDHDLEELALRVDGLEDGEAGEFALHDGLLEFVHLARGEVRRFEAAGAECAGEVVDGVGVELLVNPSVDAELVDALEVAGPGAEGRAMEQVHAVVGGGRGGEGEMIRDARVEEPVAELRAELFAPGGEQRGTGDSGLHEIAPGPS
ncbi:MAG: hypothetical protein FD180_4214 [Planctomycetota bacterium]|nr:MAG: hypothetical protein FD180_4214 [Planctomycetota bacterium]